MNRERRHVVTARHDLHAVFVQRADHRLLRDRRARPCIDHVAHVHIRLVQASRDGCRQMIYDRSEGRVRLARKVHKLRIEDRRGQIHGHIVIPEQSNEVLYLLAIEVETAGLIAVQRKTQLLARVFAITGKEIQEQHVDVLNLVIAGSDGLLCRHECRNVS